MQREGIKAFKEEQRYETKDSVQVEERTRWDGEGGGRWVLDGEHMCTRG